LLPEDHPVVEASVRAYKRAMGTDVTPRFSPPFCNDGIDANRYGLPTIVYGAGGRTLPKAALADEHVDIRNSIGEFIRIDDMVDMTVVYAMLAAELMSGGQADVARSRKLMPMPGVVTS
jgi:acetylornithine deacetylase/succinyl-diaminopimelate desuccinylase-like protein